MTPTTILVHEVSKRFGAVQALADISFTVNAGELFGLVGPDGAGKSTLFRILTTLLTPDQGIARVLGYDVVSELWQIRSRVGYMPGRFALYADLSVEENLSFFAAVFGTTIRAGYDLIAPIYRQIEPFRDRRAGALSGGMKQKLALCCALIHRPELLLLDEPTTGVDAVSRREFWELLNELRQTGLTIIASTPYMDEAARCDRVALMQNGALLAVDAPAHLGAMFPRKLFGVRGTPRTRVLAALRAYDHLASAYPFGESIHVSDRRTSVGAAVIAEELHAHLHRSGIGDVSVTEIVPGIEDAFMELMGDAFSAAA